MSKPDFPKPHRFGRACRFSLSDILRYEAVCRGDDPPPPLPPEEERFLAPKKLAARLDISLPTIWRRAAEARRTTSGEA